MILLSKIYNRIKKMILLSKIYNKPRDSFQSPGLFLFFIPSVAK